MSGLGLKGTIKKVLSANGPAQMLTYSFWGVLMAGMFQGVCEMCVPNSTLALWGAISAAVVPITVWCNKSWLRNILLLDVVVSAYILSVFMLHKPHTYNPVYYSINAAGEAAVREVGGGHAVSDWFHVTALIWMTLHAIYLADLTNRQILEKKRFEQ